MWHHFTFGLHRIASAREILLEIGFIGKNENYFNKEVPQTFFTIPLIRENTI